VNSFRPASMKGLSRSSLASAIAMPRDWRPTKAVSANRSRLSNGSGGCGYQSGHADPDSLEIEA